MRNRGHALGLQCFCLKQRLQVLRMHSKPSCVPFAGAANLVGQPFTVRNCSRQTPPTKTLLPQGEDQLITGHVRQRHDVLDCEDAAWFNQRATVLHAFQTQMCELNFGRRTPSTLYCHEPTSKQCLPRTNEMIGRDVTVNIRVLESS